MGNIVDIIARTSAMCYIIVNNIVGTWPWPPLLKIIFSEILEKGCNISIFHVFSINFKP